MIVCYECACVFCESLIRHIGLLLLALGANIRHGSDEYEMRALENGRDGVRWCDIFSRAACLGGYFLLLL